MHFKQVLKASIAALVLAQAPINTKLGARRILKRGLDKNGFDDGKWNPEKYGHHYSKSSVSSSVTTTSTISEPTSTTTTYSSTETSSTEAEPTQTKSNPVRPGRLLSSAYYADWTANVLAPEDIDFDLYDKIDYAFAVVDSNYDLQFTVANSPDILRRLVKAAHAKGTKVAISIGGWTGSKYFSPAVASEWSRTKLLDNIVKLVKEYNLDGADIDWEYPGAPGNDGNIYASHDTANLLEFLKLLRERIGTQKSIQVCTSTRTFIGADGTPLKDVSAFAEVLDAILIMNYDVWGASEFPGPNAPLADKCGNSRRPTANAKAAVEQWKAAGMPPSKMILGVPAYGYVSSSRATALVSRRSSSIRRLYEHGRDVLARSKKRLRRAVSSFSNSQISFRQLISNGALRYDPGLGKYTGVNGFVRKWDDCSSTPYLVNQNEGLVVSYDDSESLALKAKLASELGLGGYGVWEITGDTDNWDLSRALRSH